MPQFATTLGRKFVGSFSPGWQFFLWSSSAQLLMWGTLNLDRGTRPPYNLGTADAGCGILVLLTTFTSGCLQRCKDAKQQNLRCIASSLNFPWYGME